jgi:hypothetical protein
MSKPRTHSVIVILDPRTGDRVTIDPRTGSVVRR